MLYSGLFSGFSRWPELNIKETLLTRLQIPCEPENRVFIVKKAPTKLFCHKTREARARHTFRWLLRICKGINRVHVITANTPTHTHTKSFYYCTRTFLTFKYVAYAHALLPTCFGNTCQTHTMKIKICNWLYYNYQYHV